MMLGERWAKIDCDPSLAARSWRSIGLSNDSHNARSITVIIANHANNGKLASRSLCVRASRAPADRLHLICCCLPGRTNYGQVSAQLLLREVLLLLLLDGLADIAPLENRTLAREPVPNLFTLRSVRVWQQRHKMNRCLGQHNAPSPPPK